MTRIKQSAIDFFYEHAGYSHDPAIETPEEGRLRCAEALAEAEAFAETNGIVVSWSADWDVNHTAEFDYEPETCEHAAALMHGEVVASLGCIDDATPEYRRVVEAQLADEARTAYYADPRD